MDVITKSDDSGLYSKFCCDFWLPPFYYWVWKRLPPNAINASWRICSFWKFSSISLSFYQVFATYAIVLSGVFVLYGNSPQYLSEHLLLVFVFGWLVFVFEKDCHYAIIINASWRICSLWKFSSRSLWTSSPPEPSWTPFSPLAASSWATWKFSKKKNYKKLEHLCISPQTWWYKNLNLNSPVDV